VGQHKKEEREAHSKNLRETPDFFHALILSFLN
jgi:hypothetical protein